MTKVSINVDKCIGCGACSATCPNQIGMDDSNKPYFKMSEIKSKRIFRTKRADCYKKAADICPVKVIKVK